MMHEYQSFDGDHFPYRSVVSSSPVDTVIIGVHGISGASYDYIGLGEHLLSHLPSCALYAYEVRGQGLDPNKGRVGDIHRAEEWYRDLYTFTRKIRGKHPGARILWCGESMGSLITLHAYANRPAQEKMCEGIILLAPVVKIGKQIPAWKLRMAKVIAWMFPKIRIKLGLLNGMENVKVTQGSDSHEAQSETNPWHIESYTLRLLSTLGAHIERMIPLAAGIEHPILVLNGGQDYFTPPNFTEEFVANIPAQVESSHYYLPEAYHLLMYDEQRERVFRAISEWIADNHAAPDQIA